ncbi:hypothetical protein EDEG_04029 [Edhazardia aedis USNM 41457]|uniref:CID domain-containing protein n=1 Tax=Edhazardia aedis (strain USNM 41457) TaxID=1003232 RepID=J9D070_EDHAE|nr:hypothetical protein EDEG_04036 [Edhazardia aedis USNM 41457]EJW01285.1 hypothetical protein EDEG_04029 [Edhazardia aedis USNM 41457]|eukprot:EJW01266.1 hypothetical protein EDEG_04036 [Edhazardia aedis USNM 41457]
MIQPEFLIHNLQTLINTQESIKSVSYYIRLNSQNYLIILEIFKIEFSKSNAYHKLNLLYLLNEIIKSEKCLDPSSEKLVNEFKQILPSLFLDACKSGKVLENTHVVEKLRELQNFWTKKKLIKENSINLL